MATMAELHSEFLSLNETYERLVRQRGALTAAGADGAAFQDLAYQTRQYVKAHQLYVEKLLARRRQLSGQLRQSP